MGWERSYLIPFLDLPVVDGTVIRGEIIMDRNVFKRKYSKVYKNPRNAVGGIINADFTLKNTEKYKDLDFVAYEVIRPRLKPTEQMAFLEEHHKIEGMAWKLDWVASFEMLGKRQVLL